MKKRLYFYIIELLASLNNFLDEAKICSVSKSFKYQKSYITLFIYTPIVTVTSSTFSQIKNNDGRFFNLMVLQVPKNIMCDSNRSREAIKFFLWKL